jgi:hypothetical protein
VQKFYFIDALHAYISCASEALSHNTLSDAGGLVRVPSVSTILLFVSILCFHVLPTALLRFVKLVSTYLHCAASSSALRYSHNSIWPR